MAGGQYGGLPRERIPWYPTIAMDRCTKCGSCVSFCHNGVYADTDDGPVVRNPFSCVVGCTGCVSQCGSNAITFPTLMELRDTLERLRKEFGMLRGGL